MAKEQKITLEEEFYKLQKEHNELRAFVFGAITTDNVPQIGVAGNGFDILILISALVKNLADHVDDTEENVLGTVYELVSEARSVDKETKS